MKNPIYMVGFCASLIAFISTIGYCTVQLLQVGGAIHFPLDEILIYGTSLTIAIPFLLAFLALHYVTPVEKKFWSHAALIFCIIYTVFVSANYVVQLATVIPMKLKGSLAQVQLLDQTPHSLFWNFDALGYIFMGLATLAAIPVFDRRGFQKWVRISFLANAMVTPLICIVYFYPTFSPQVLLMGYPWGITAPLSMLMLALMFKKHMKRTNGAINKRTRPPVDTRKPEGATDNSISFVDFIERCELYGKLQLQKLNYGKCFISSTKTTNY